MKISTQSKYAIRALANLALKNGYSSVKEISSQENISYDYLEKIFAKLKKSGFIKVKRGTQGGYILSRKPQNISVGEIIQSLEGSFAPVKCIDAGAKFNCPKNSDCLTRNMWQKIQQSFITTLNSITLDSLIKTND